MIANENLDWSLRASRNESRPSGTKQALPCPCLRLTDVGAEDLSGTARSSNTSRKTEIVNLWIKIREISALYSCPKNQLTNLRKVGSWLSQSDNAYTKYIKSTQNETLWNFEQKYGIQRITMVSHRLLRSSEKHFPIEIGRAPNSPSLPEACTNDSWFLLIPWVHQRSP